MERQKIKCQQIQKIQFDQETKQHAYKKSRQSYFAKGVINISYSQINSLHLIFILRQQTKQFIDISKIKIFNLSGNNIDDQGIKQLCKKDYNWISLQQLGLSFNNITMKGIQYLSKGAQINLFPQLSLLYLCYNQIGSNNQNIELSNQQQIIQDGLFLIFANNTKLKMLQLFQNKINDKDMLKLFKSKDIKNLKIFNYLQSIFLFNNKLTKCQISIFDKQLLYQYPSLKFLYLQHNKINKDGIKCLVNSISKNEHKMSLSKLQQLSLSDNDLSSQAIKILVSNKNIFKNLKLLLLYQNSLIRDQGIYHFMKACQEGAFPILQKLDIADINLSDFGIENIIKIYNQSKTFSSLKQINLMYNRIANQQLTKKKLQKRFKLQVKLKLIQKEEEE